MQRCAAAIGDERRFFTTADTVEDLDALRRALGVRKLALDGTSYGTYVAQRYALAHPDNVSRLVLDSVVPAGRHQPALDRPDPGRRARARRGHRARPRHGRQERAATGPQMLDMLTGLSVGAPRGNGAAQALEAAANGNIGPLEGLQAGVSRVMKSWTAEKLSQGLHASTLCADMPAPWGDASAPLEGRKEALEREAARLDDLYPFDRETATGNGIAQQCLNWPPVDVPKPDGPTRPPGRPGAPAGRRRSTSRPRWSGRSARPPARPAASSSWSRTPGTASRARRTRRCSRPLRAFVAALAG